MPQITVRDENRPSFGKYVAYTAAAILLVDGLVITLTQGAGNPAVALVGVAVAAVANIAILFLMVQSLIQEWFAAAELVDD